MSGGGQVVPGQPPRRGNQHAEKVGRRGYGCARGMRYYIGKFLGVAAYVKTSKFCDKMEHDGLTASATSTVNIAMKVATLLTRGI